METTDRLCVVCGAPTEGTIGVRSHRAGQRTERKQGMVYACEQHTWEAQRLLTRALDQPRRERTVGTWTR